MRTDVLKKVLEPTAAGTLVYPNNQGATNWYSPSYSPRTGLFYIPSWTDTSSIYRKDPGNPPTYTEGAQFTGIFPTVTFGTDSLPALAADADEHPFQSWNCRRSSGVRSQDRGKEMDVRDERRHRCGSPDDFDQRSVQRRQGRLLLCAGRA